MNRWTKTALIVTAGLAVLTFGCDNQEIALTVKNAGLDWLEDAVKAFLDSLFA